MSSIFDSLMGQLGGDQLDALAGAIGADRDSTAKAVGAGLPVLLGALSSNAASDHGAGALLGALSRDHDGSVLDDLFGFLSGGQTAPGAAILGHVLGARQGAAQQQIARVSGLDMQSAGRLLAMLAPIVLGMLGRKQRQAGLDQFGLADLLGRERETASAALPGGLGGVLTQVLDRDGDGSILDDAAGLLGGLLGGRR